MRTLFLLFSSSCLVVSVSSFISRSAVRTHELSSSLCPSEKAGCLIRAKESSSSSSSSAAAAPSSSSYDLIAALRVHPDNETWKVVSTDGESKISSFLSSSTLSPARHDVIFFTLLICSFATISAFPLIVHAVDHPVDHDLLGIPIPVPDVRYFISGGLCAACSHGVTVPIDVAKTRIQSDETRCSDNLLETMTDIVQTEGKQALLGGLGPTVVGYGLEGAAKFGLYESLKPIFANIWNIPPGSDPSLPYLAASVVAGGVASLMLCPLEQTRIRLVTDPTFRQDGLISGLSRLIQQEGLSSTLFGGISPMLSKQVPYTIGKQVSFDEFAGMLYNVADTFSVAAQQVKTEVSIAAAFMASIVACILSHPGDVLLTATFKGQKEGEIKAELPSFTDLVRDIWAKEGFSGFWTGLSARFFHVGAIITSQLVLYDFIKQLLGLPATGSHH